MSASSFSLHIGINGVDTNHYQQWDGRLQGCENDALFYHQLAQKEGCKVSKILLNSDHSNKPTSTNVLAFLDYSISELNAGDNLIITYSGHGGILEDKNFDEHDFQDETWCLYDRQLLDDELFARFSRFRAGVNIFVISDSCHSGSVVKAITDEALPDTRIRRFVPRQQLFATYQANKSIYEPLMRTPIVREEEIPAAVLQLGACQDDEFAMEDGENGLFTKTIMKILERNGEVGSYQELLVRSKRALSGIQRPNLICYGSNHQQLLNQRPFGSSYTEGVSSRINLFDEKGSLIVEANGTLQDLSTIKEFMISKTLPVPEKEGHVVYHCSCSVNEPGMYPWDHAYIQYRFLKEQGFPVCCVEPDEVMEIADKLSPDRDVRSTDSPIQEIRSTDCADEEIRSAIFCKLFKGKIRSSRGLGKTKEIEDDDVLIQMFSLEMIQVIRKDEDLKKYRTMQTSELEKHLSNPANYETFTSLVKNSIFSSDTLTVHL